MQDPSTELIEGTAKVYDITIDDTTPVECLFFVYAHVFKKSSVWLKEKPILKDAIEKISRAFDEIYENLLQREYNGNIPEKIYPNICKIKDPITQVLSNLSGVLGIYDSTIPPQQPTQETREEMRLRYEAIGLLTEGLLECRKYVSYIDSQIGWWCEAKEVTICLDDKSGSPSIPTDIVKEKKRRKQKPA